MAVKITSSGIDAVTNIAVEGQTDISGQFSINSNGEVEFLENNPTCTEQEILKRMNEILEEYDATSYINYRKAEYDKLNQFELMYNDKIY